jgi:Bax protein
MTAVGAIALTASHHAERLSTPFEGLVPNDMLRAAPMTDGACDRSDRVTMITGISASALSDLYQSVDYDLDSIRDGDRRVPKILVADLPSDLRTVKPIDDRKALFVKSVLPAILYINAQIAAQRHFVESARTRVKSGQPLSDAQQSRLAQLADCYGTDARDFDGLLRRVDIVPPALGLAQAAIESRWGTSHFARRGNAILGQHTHSKDGIVPAGAQDADFRVRSFGHMPESVAAFMHNLNTHPAYRSFREMRARLRREDRPLDSIALAGKLLRYSTRRADYVKQVRGIIRSNHFEPFDSARLNNGSGAPDDSLTATAKGAVSLSPPDAAPAPSSATPDGTG